MYKHKFKFTGGFLEFLAANLGLGLDSFATLGVLVPYWLFNQ